MAVAIDCRSGSRISALERIECQPLDEEREAFSEVIGLFHQLSELIPTLCKSDRQPQRAESVRASRLSIGDEYASNFKNRGQEPRRY